MQIGRCSLCYFNFLSSKTDPHPSKETPFLHIFIPNPLPGLQKALLWRPAYGHELQHSAEKGMKAVLARTPCCSGHEALPAEKAVEESSGLIHSIWDQAERTTTPDSRKSCPRPRQKPRALCGIKLAQLQSREELTSLEVNARLYTGFTVRRMKAILNSSPSPQGFELSDFF